jgi:hypothetical protein
MLSIRPSKCAGHDGDKPLTKSIEIMAGGEGNNAAENGTGTDCRDCIFWYRCKHGGIDCELKAR